MLVIKLLKPCADSTVIAKSWVTELVVQGMGETGTNRQQSIEPRRVPCFLMWGRKKNVPRETRVFCMTALCKEICK
jgi:hypothetical protein